MMEIKRLLVGFGLVLVLITNAFSQNIGIGINADGSAPAGSAVLDVSSTTKGFLPPRMTYAQKAAIAGPVAGLMVYCTNCGKAGELQVFNGTTWTNVIGSAAAAGKPDAPTIGTATAGAGQATVAFTQPASNGGFTITSYTATSSPGNITGMLSQAGSGTITVTGLTAGTTYTFTVTATTVSGTGPASSASNSVTPTVPLIDGSGNTYETVTIGTQTWMTKNLNTTKYNDGIAILNVTSDAAWAIASSGYYRDYSNTEANSTTYGKLYNWFVVDNNVSTKAISNGGRNVCPKGWHVPSDADWTTLTNFLGGETVAGGKLKEAGNSHWLDFNTGADNSSGFTALPAAAANSNGFFSPIGINGFWWSTTAFSTAEAWNRNVNSNTAMVFRSHTSVGKKNGYSVRCLKD